ncbi:hypothetical protein FCV25MIE_06029 [Fagus crenata]
MGSTYIFNQSKRFYVCSVCLNHVASREDYLYKVVDVAEPILNAGIFEDTVNLHVPNESQIHLYGNTGNASNTAFIVVHCNICNTCLGQTCVLASQPNSRIKEGRVLLAMLLYWNGHQQLDGNEIELPAGAPQLTRQQLGIPQLKHEQLVIPE